MEALRCAFIKSMGMGNDSGGAGTLRSRAISVGALLLLSALTSSGVLRAALFPGRFSETHSSLAGDVWPFALLALVAGSSAVVRGATFPRGWQIRNAVLIGLMMFAVPIGLAYFAEGSVSRFARTALLTLVPVFAVVLEPYLGGEDGSPSGGRLLAALAGVAGALFVFPIEMPGSLGDGAGMCAAVVAAASVAYANCRLVALSADARGNRFTGRVSFAAISGATAAVCLGVASTFVERPVWSWEALGPMLVWSTLVDLSALLLLFWLARRMSAARMATRFLIAPMLAILLGAPAIQAHLEARTWLGLLLMAAGAGYILFAKKAEPDHTVLFEKQ